MVDEEIVHLSVFLYQKYAFIWNVEDFIRSVN